MFRDPYLTTTQVECHFHFNVIEHFFMSNHRIRMISTRLESGIFDLFYLFLRFLHEIIYRYIYFYSRPAVAINDVSLKLIFLLKLNQKYLHIFGFGSQKTQKAEILRRLLSLNGSFFDHEACFLLVALLCSSICMENMRQFLLKFSA